jgi:uncharacterized protein YyaL (SSP411 family)
MSTPSPRHKFCIAQFRPAGQRCKSNRASAFALSLLLFIMTMTGAGAAGNESPQFTNRLANEKSPYLLQHAHNPVDWYAWGAEAFAKARRENKPIFLSIGYSTCHWCHVMEREEFEKEDVAAIMNRDFVNIKVDREERPDVDRVYMTFVQATTGGGGWPMSVWLTPDLKPFVGGTYFPPDDRYGQPGFTKVLGRIADAWKKDHEKIAQSSDQIIATLSNADHAASPSSERLGTKVLEAGYQEIARGYDAREGGFGSAPKFPRPVTLNFLFRFYARGVAQVSNLRNQQNATSKVAPQAERALEMNLFTLRKMAAGGIHDHLGGGFHRYSVDAYWHVPHFEKMLYDQAQLAVAYLDAFQITHDAFFESVARDTLDYVRREMTDKAGGFYSAEDADSLFEQGKPEHGEGAFYVWTKKEIDHSVGKDAKIFDYHYGVQAEGNTPPGSDPQGEFRGRNILIERHSTAETAKHFGEGEEAVRDSLHKSRATLFALREKRPRPHLDDKIITAWNGLMISAFARGAQVLGDAGYLETATRAADFIQTQLWDESKKTLTRSYREGRSADGFADDYAFFIQGLLDLYEASFDAKWLKFALQLQQTQDRLFSDEKSGGYFSGTGKDPSILLRMKEDYDNAEPAPSSVAARNLLRLAQIRDAKELQTRAGKTISAFGTQLSRIPSAMPLMLVALDFSLSKPKQVVIAGKRDADDTRALLTEVHKHFLPNTILLLADGAESQKFLDEKLEAVRAMSPIDGKAAAYVCENFSCQAPVTESKQLAELLSR